MGGACRALELGIQNFIRTAERRDDLGYLEVDVMILSRVGVTQTGF
jgi:hypothetical protein